MRSISFCIFALALSVSADKLHFNDFMMPILYVISSFGQNNLNRIDQLHAEIHPRHVTTNQRVNFPRSGRLNEYFREISAPGDERGHLVASQFSGPAKWYNLSPQSAIVNRNYGFQAITTDWYGTECEVREFLERGGNRYVSWTVDMSYIDDSNRPDEYRLQVRFYNNGRELRYRAIDTTVHNPFREDNSIFWICRKCRSYKRKRNDEKDELRRRRRYTEIQLEECEQVYTM